MRLFGIDPENYYVVLWSWRIVAVGLVIVCDAFIAHLFENRKLFWIGLLGTIFGAFVPKQKVYSHYSSVEAGVLGTVQESFEHIFVCAFLGMVTANLLFVYWRHKRKPHKTTPLDSQDSGVTNPENGGQ